MARPQIPTAFTSPSSIRVDELNPRQPPQATQTEAIQTLIEGQGKKIVALAKDINKIGLSAAERFIVIEAESKGKGKKYISLDGNRRLLALKLLADPSIAEGILSKSQVAAIKKEATTYAANPIDKVEIAIYPDRKEGSPWVARRHGREMKGVGQDSWGAEEGAHFSAWRNENKGHADLQILLFVRRYGNLTEIELQQLAKFPLTNLRRVIGNETAKKIFGYQIVKGDVITSYSNEEFVKPFKKMLLDMTNPDRNTRIKVTELEDDTQRTAYINSFTASELPSNSKPKVTAHILGDEYESLPEEKPKAEDKSKEEEKSKEGEQPKEDEKKEEAKPQNSENKGDEQPKEDEKKGDKKPKETRLSTQQRTQIIPEECVLNISSQRIHDIYDELKYRINSNTSRNASAVLLRVFIELSVDDFIARHPADIHPRGAKNNNSSLGDKLWAVAEYAANNSLITEAEAASVYDGTKEENILAPRVKTMHSYVHSAAASPLAYDLRLHWNNIEPLMKAIWA